MFLGCLGAGPDPHGMSCEQIKKGYETNLALSKSRSSAKARKNSADRVTELEPYYKNCGFTPGAGATPGATPMPMPTPDGGGGGGGGGMLVPDGGGGFRPPVQAGISVNWGRVGTVVGVGVVGLVLFSMLVRKKRGSRKGRRASMRDVRG